MVWLINLIAVLVAIAGLLAVLGNDAYLAMLGNVAKKRAGGQVTETYVRRQLPLAVGTTAASVVSLLLLAGGPFSDVIAMVVGAGAGALSLMQLGGVRRNYGSSQLR